MIASEAILKFVYSQKRLLRDTYDQAWQRGVVSYTPDDDPPVEPTLPKEMAITGLSGAALLMARRRYNYVAPTHPDPIRRAVALAPSFNGMNRMSIELSTLPTAEDVSGWVASNAYRLDAGDSVAWAGEQTGFAEAADQDGQFLFSWASVGDNRVCPECELFASFPAMPLSEWAVSPGDGSTSCLVGCRCTWETWPIPDGNYQPNLSMSQRELMNTVADRQSQALTTMIPDVQFIEG